MRTFSEYECFSYFRTFRRSGRTELKRGVSGAKLDVEYDFEVLFVAALQKLSQNDYGRCISVITMTKFSQN